ncbi:unnamed protein product [Gulo gulo]|uniref:Uncharacterized protein n=1 Tax=Gulo gulo TaxID=48420 RepID=A0A9X9LFH7_GULGU|nr:unnamed protein product [Gulo gulo]
MFTELFPARKWEAGTEPAVLPAALFPCGSRSLLPVTAPGRGWEAGEGYATTLCLLAGPGRCPCRGLPASLSCSLWKGLGALHPSRAWRAGSQFWGPLP